MRVVFVSSEAWPYASTGGLADVCGSLPRALQACGVDTVTILPLYRRIMEGDFPVEDTGIRLSIPVGFHQYAADIWKAKGTEPPVYFIRRDEFFDRSQLYNLPERDYDDNFERFILFQKAATALIDHMGRPFDIVHAHDWQTGLLPLYLKHGLNGEGREGNERTVMTIHNLAFQGVFDGDEYSYTNLPFSCFDVDNLEYYGNINCLKGGIVNADLVTTVSKTYAREIQSEEMGCGLQGVLSTLRGKLTGIVNGIDTDSWNPATDTALAANYSLEDPANKRLCKRDLIQRMRLTMSEDEPLLGMVTRLTAQKGVDLLDHALPRIMSETTASLVLLGNGSADMEALVRGWQKKWPGRVVVKTAFDLKLARRIIAGSDIFLMPSKFEPCGLNQLYSMRYGTIPVVHNVGGLADTVWNVSDDLSRGYGFKFDHHKPFPFFSAIRKALTLYEHQEAWQKTMRRAMEQDFSWAVSAKEYKRHYEDLRVSAREQGPG